MIIAIFTAVPTLAGALLSLFEWSGSAAPKFIGLQNYYAVFNTDQQAGFAARNTIIFAIGTVPITVVLSFLAAVVMRAEWLRGRALLRTIYFLPTVISIVAIGFLWRWLLDPHAGLVNTMLETLGIDAVASQWPLPWLGDSPWSLGALCFVHVWRNLGFCIVLYLAALSRVPRSLYEAGAVDGAGGWRTTWRLTWPAVKPMTVFVVVTSSIWSLQVFDLVWVITGGAQQTWTDVLNTHLYREFSANRLGYAAMIGVIVLLLTALVTGAQLWWMRDRTRAGA